MRNGECGMRNGWCGFIPHSAIRIPHSDRVRPAARPGPCRPDRGGEDGCRRCARRTAPDRGDLRRCAPGVSPPRHRHRQALARGPGRRAALRDRRGRSGRALQRGPVCPRRRRMARPGAGGGTRARRGGWNRLLRARVGGRVVSGAAPRSGAARVVARLDGPDAGRAAGALGGAPRPRIRGRRTAARRPRHRGGPVDGAGALLVAARGARDRRNAPMVHSPDAAARRAAATDRRTGGPDARRRARG